MKHFVYFLGTIFICLYLNCSICFGGEIDESEGGTFVFNSRNVQFNEGEALSGKDANRGTKSECLDTTLMTYLYTLQVINPESVITLATKNKLDKICVNISKTIDKMQNYLKTCSLQPQQEAFDRLLKGVSTLYKKLCTHDPYHKMFMEHKKCLGQLQSEFSSCNGPADWSDNADSKKVCKAYQEIADCYYIKTSVLCGNAAADVFKELVNTVIDSVITVNCSNNSTAFGNLNRQAANDADQGNGTLSVSCVTHSYIFIILLLFNILKSIPDCNMVNCGLP